MFWALVGVGWPKFALELGDLYALSLDVVVACLQGVICFAEFQVLLLKAALAVAYWTQLYQVVLHLLHCYCWNYFHSVVVDLHLLQLALLMEKQVRVYDLLLLLCPHHRQLPRLTVQLTQLFHDLLVLWIHNLLVTLRVLQLNVQLAQLCVWFWYWLQLLHNVVVFFTLCLQFAQFQLLSLVLVSKAFVQVLVQLHIVCQFSVANFQLIQLLFKQAHCIVGFLLLVDSLLSHFGQSLFVVKLQVVLFLFSLDFQSPCQFLYFLLSFCQHLSDFLVLF